MFVIALCKVQTVGFEKLSKAFDSEKVEKKILVCTVIAAYFGDSGWQCSETER